MKTLRIALIALACLWATLAAAQITTRVVDVPSRDGVTVRVLFLTPLQPDAVYVLLAGGHGGLQLAQDGSMRWGSGNFLVRMRQQFAEQGVAVAVVDAPSDKQQPPFLEYFRQTPQHAADLREVIRWARTTTGLPVWLIGTSRGTQSVAYVATALKRPEGPDGIVLSSSILIDRKAPPVQAMALEDIDIPVLVVHHQEDGCWACPYRLVPDLMRRLHGAPRSGLITAAGGQNSGASCMAFAHHGYNGIELDVVQRMVEWTRIKSEPW